MRILLVGGGGREHAIAWKLRQDDPAVVLIAAPGNPGIAELAECVDISALDVAALRQLAQDRQVELTIVGPEAPLAAGLVDEFRAAGLVVFGPTRAAAELESSKAFAKRVMREAAVPTARAESHVEVSAAVRALGNFSLPVVIKASGLAAGKGVVICDTHERAETAIRDMLSGNRFGAAGAEVLLEEFMEGEELSVFAITDGTAFVMLPALQDHKRLLHGDRGPNTGGMGAYTPVSLGLDRAERGQLDEQIASRVIEPTLRAMRAMGRPFTGLLYAGLMVNEGDVRVVEFNCRFGDPETQALLPLIHCEPSFASLLLSAAAGGDALRGPVAIATHGASVTTVIASPGYPDTPALGDAIQLPDAGKASVLFHAGTARRADGSLITSGGRVLAATVVAPTLREARDASLALALATHIPGAQVRRDIAWRELQREADAGTPGD